MTILMPPFSIVVGVTAVNGVAPTTETFTFELRNYPSDVVKVGPVVVTGTEQATLTVDQATATAMYANFQSGMDSPSFGFVQAFPCRLRLAETVRWTTLAGVVTVTETGATRPFTAELYVRGGQGYLGFICWRHGANDAIMADNDTAGGTPDVRTYAQFAERYLTASGWLPNRPRRFYLGEYFHAGDTDRNHADVAYDAWARLGVTLVNFQFGNDDPDPYLDSGLFERFSASEYTVAGGQFPWRPIDPNTPGFAPTPAGIAAWAADWNTRIEAAGFDPSDLAHFAMADEPGWYPETETDGIAASTPTTIRDPQARSDALTDFRAYVAGRGYVAADFGVGSLDDLMPDGTRALATGTRAERLLYTVTLRWLDNAGARHFRDSLMAMLDYFPNGTFAANKNNFSSRPVSEADFWPTPFAGFSWLAEGAMPGSHPGSESYLQAPILWIWSPIVALLESSSRRGAGLDRTTSFVIRSGSTIAGDFQRRVLIHLIHGAKGLHGYTLGPPYVANDAPIETLLKLPAVIDDLKDTSELVAAVEHLLYPGRRAASPIALVHPWGAAMFDTAAYDGTEPVWFRNSSDHVGEAFGIALALAHAGIPFDWIHEDDLSADGLADYRFLYLTAPNLSADQQDAVAAWAALDDRVLITTLGAGAFDEVNDALTTVADLGGISASHVRQRLTDLITSSRPWTVNPSAAVVDVPLPSAVQVVRDPFAVDPTQYRSTVTGGTSLGTYADSGNSAVALAAVGTGHRIHFGWYPGLAYTYGGVNGLNTDPTKLPTEAAGWERNALDWVTWPLRNFGYQGPVETTQHAIETAFLPSASGAAVGVISWWGEPTTTDITIRPGFRVGRVTSQRQGRLDYTVDEDQAITVAGLDLDNVDVLMLDAIRTGSSSLLMAG